MKRQRLLQISRTKVGACDPKTIQSQVLGRNPRFLLQPGEDADQDFHHDKGSTFDTETRPRSIETLPRVV